MDRIKKVHSIDLVCNAGTVKGLFEDEESVVNSSPEMQRLAEESLAAMDNARMILFDPETSQEEKHGLLLECIREWSGTLLEGEIGDELAKTEPMHKMRRMQDIAYGKLDDARWDSAKYPTHDDKRKRHLEVLNDWTKELKSLNTGDCLTEEEVPSMEWKDITPETLKANRPDMVAVLQGTDEHSRLTEEATAQKATVAARDKTITELTAQNTVLKATETKRLQEEETSAELKAAFPGIPETDDTVFSAEFKEQLSAAPDKAARQKVIGHTKRLLEKLYAATGTPPMTEVFHEEEKRADAPNANYNRLFAAQA